MRKKATINNQRWGREGERNIFLFLILFYATLVFNSDKFKINAFVCVLLDDHWKMCFWQSYVVCTDSHIEPLKKCMTLWWRRIFLQNLWISWEFVYGASWCAYKKLTQSTLRGGGKQQKRVLVIYFFLLIVLRIDVQRATISIKLSSFCGTFMRVFLSTPQILMWVPF